MKKKLLSLFLILAMAVGLLSVQAFAETGTPLTAQVTLTVSNRGKLALDRDGGVMANRPVTVTDRDGDGSLTFHEAMLAAHETYLTEDAYACADFAEKLWNQQTSNLLFFLNNQGLANGVKADTVKDGDVLTASVNQDDKYYADWFTCFDTVEKQAAAGENVRLNLKGHLGMAMAEADKVFCPIANVQVGYWKNGTYIQAEGVTTDQAGNAVLSFQEPGTYYVTASGTVAAKAQDWSQGGQLVDVQAPIIAPVCVVTVTEAQSVPAERQLAALEFGSGSNAEKDGYVPYALVPDFDPAVKNYTIAVPDSTSGLYGRATLGTEVTGDIEICYGSNVKKLTSGGNGTSLYGVVRSGNLRGNVLTVKVGSQEAYTVTVIREATLQSLTLTDTANQIDLPVEFNKDSTVYQVEVPQDAVIEAKAEPKSGEAFVALNGEKTTQVSPVWGPEGTCELQVKAMGPNAESRIYRIELTNMGPAVRELEISAAPNKTAYGIGEQFDPAGMEVLVHYKDGTTQPITQEQFAYAPDGKLFPDNTQITVSYKYAQAEQPITVAPALDGEGTKDSPYLLRSAKDLDAIREDVQKGYDYAGKYLQMTQNIALEKTWEPISPAKGNAAFAGNFDGGNYTLTFAPGSKPLFAYVHGAVIENLNIYAPFMDGYAVVANHVQSGGGTIAEFRSVTLKSGSVIRGGGFMGGYASGSDVVNFTDCMVEQNVKIGCNEDGTSAGLEYVGSFGGRINGTVKNCVSYADVYGTARVGGIVGGMGQSMGTFLVDGCKFYGSVHASGDMAGGIVGAGYSDMKFGPAPNAPCASILNCTASGSVSGASKVGGILGCENTLQCWDNGIGKIQNNVFTGTVQGTGDSVGGIVGFMMGLDKYNEISGNQYSKDCGAAAGAGSIRYIDTSCTTHETASGAVYFDTSVAIPEIPKSELGSWGSLKSNHNRTDDPLGADADALWSNSAEKPTVTVFEPVGSYKTLYTVGDALDLTGMKLKAVWSDGREDVLELSEVEVGAFDSSTAGEKTLEITWKGEVCRIPLTVSDPLHVTIVVLGDENHTQTETTQVHTLFDQNLTQWIPETEKELPADAKVIDLIRMVLEQNSMTLEMKGDNYISAVNGLGEFDNGPKSGWMYTLNGVHPDLGVSAQPLREGDKIVLHYTDDYFREYMNAEQQASEVTAMIAAIPQPVSLEDREEIARVRRVFAALAQDVQEKVENLDKLVQAEKALETLEEDNAQAQKVSILIDAIGKVTADSKTAVEAARQAYAALTPAQQKLVENYEKLVLAELNLDVLLAPSWQEIYELTGNQMQTAAEESVPQVGTVQGEWLVLGLVRSGRPVPQAYYDAVAAYTAEYADENGRLSRNKSTDNSRIILALTAMGRNPADVAGHNLLAGLADMSYVQKQGINGTIWALIALDSHAYEIPQVGGENQTTREGLIAAILEAQLPQGGWSLGTDPSVDMTAMALQALAPYCEQAEVLQAVEQALAYLKECQNPDGSFSEDGISSSESCAQVIVALTALGKDPAELSRNGISVLDALRTFAAEQGGFRHQKDGELNAMATEQGYYALAAYDRFLRQANRLYDMTDVEIPVILPEGWNQDENGWFYMENGKKKTDSWKEDSKGWVYLNAEGYVSTNTWAEDSTGRCYLDGSGYMMKASWLHDGQGWSYLDANGYAAANTWLQDSAGWCYMGTDGYAVTNGWAQDSIGWCYLDAEGHVSLNVWAQDSVGWCYLGADGYVVTNGWAQDSVGWCYLGADGYLLTDAWMQDSWDWCYLGSDGRMVTNTWIQDSVGWCYLDASGYLLRDGYAFDSVGEHYLDASGHIA